MSYVDYADKLEHELEQVPGVEQVAVVRLGPDDLRFVVVLSSSEWDVRHQVVQMVDQYAQQYVYEVGVDLEVVEAAHADRLVSCA